MTSSRSPRDCNAAPDLGTDKNKGSINSITSRDRHGPLLLDRLLYPRWRRVSPRHAASTANSLVHHRLQKWLPGRTYGTPSPHNPQGIKMGTLKVSPSPCHRPPQRPRSHQSMQAPQAPHWAETWQNRFTVQLAHFSTMLQQELSKACSVCLA